MLDKLIRLGQEAGSTTQVEAVEVVTIRLVTTKAVTEALVAVELAVATTGLTMRTSLRIVLAMLMPMAMLILEVVEPLGMGVRLEQVMGKATTAVQAS